MLPGPNPDRISLADVFPSCLAALSGVANQLGFGRVDSAIVVLVDGLGASSLRARGGHARTMSTALAAGPTIDSIFPTTTAAALASLTTGVRPGIHGLVGYSVLDAAHDRVINQLSGWDDELDPAVWQSEDTVFQRAGEMGFDAVVVGPARYEDTGFTHAVLRGARYRAAASIADRFRAAADWLRESRPSGLLYLYIPELDSAAHKYGWESPEWTARLEELDGELAAFVAHLGASDGVVLTADHGVVDVPTSSHILIDTAPELLEGIRFVAGEPRCLQLHFDADLSADDREALVALWRQYESSRSWVVTREEAIEAGWFGTVSKTVEPRIGDLLVAARKKIAYYDARTASVSSMQMVGQHGSWSAEEMQVPLLRFGAFGR